MNNQDITIIKRIEDYLTNQLTASEKEAFELEMQQNKTLSDAVAIQQQVLEGITRSTQRKEIQKIGKRFHLVKKVQIAVVSVIIAVSTIAIAYFLTKNIDNKQDSHSEMSLSLLDSLQQKAPIERLKSEFFEWNGQDSVLLSKKGVLLSVPENAFLLDGKPFDGNAIIQWQEATEAKDIIKAGLSTTSNGNLLETQGMFGVEAYTTKGKKLTVNPKVGLYVQVPVKEHKKGMQLFSGKKDKQGVINWVDPKPLEKIPVSIPMNKLNFYPTALVDTLNILGKPTDRKYRDSLYSRLKVDENKEIDFKMVLKNKQVESDLKKFVSVKKINQNNYEIDFDYGFQEKIGREMPKLRFEIENYEKLKKLLMKPWNLLSMNLDNLNDLSPVPFGYKLLTENDVINFSSITVPQKRDFYIKLVNNKNEIIYNELIINNKEQSLLVDDILKKIFKTQRNLNQTLLFLDFKKSFSSKHTFKFKTSEKKIAIPIIFKAYSENKSGFTGFFLCIDNSEKQTTFLPPSKVLAFWNAKFDNTNLATREFESRMQAIHNICDASNRNKVTTSKLLETYTANLDKSIKYADEQAVKMGFPQFQTFVDENVGAVNPNNPHLKNLTKFYDKAIVRLEQELVGYKDKEQSIDAFMNKQIQQERSKETQRTNERNNQNLSEEYQLNLEDVYKQLGKTVSFTIGKGGNSSNIVNIDKYVMDATISRTSTTITDPETGKTAQITYHPFSLEVENHQKYNQLFVYLLPSKMNSFQRLNLTNGKINYNLNNLMEYDVVVVGVTDNEYFVSHTENIKKGDLGKLTLSSISEKELDKLLQKANKKREVEKPMSFKDELRWLKSEQQFVRYQTKKRNDQLFLERMRRIVYPCYQALVDGHSEEPIEEYADTIPFK